RLGLDQKFYNLLGTPIRELTVPVRPGRDMGSILEIAARNELLRRAGTNSSLEFMGRLEQQLVTHAAVDSHADPNALFAGPAAPVPPAPGSSVPAESSRVSWTGSNESSAWIPAVRPKGSDE
ncbi:MAG: HPr kinase/phosphorylase, partial [Myxococcaceae bacterium]|nr:HPr kinase/phosphorylase [Myxococcaceae bacterium]